MAPLKEKSSNVVTAKAADDSKGEAKKASPNTSRKRKSDAANDDQENGDTSNKKSKQQKTSDVKDDKSTSNGKAKASRSSSKKATPTKKEQQEAELAKWDISDINLDGQHNDSVPVYDTCSDIRTKINAHMRHAPAKLSSQAAFVREISKCMADAKGIQGMSTRSLGTWLKKKGPCGGASSPIYYASYVYLEKLRIKQNKKKSQKREEMEQEWGQKGVDFSDSDARMFMHRDERVEITKYGRMNIHRMPR